MSEVVNAEDGVIANATRTDAWKAGFTTFGPAEILGEMLAPDSLSISFEWWKNRYAGVSLPEALRDFSASLDCEETGTGLTVSTIHAAKGLEFPAVIIPAMSIRRVSAEEWRTMLVAVSRAKNTLVICGPSTLAEVASGMQIEK